MQHEHEYEILNRLARIEVILDSLSRQPTEQDFYSVEDFAKIVKRQEFTVREWCRLVRINADKRPCGRGRTREWKIAHEELQRYRDDGLLPPKK